MITTIGTSVARHSGEVEFRSGVVLLKGELIVPKNATAIVLFAHGSGSSRHSPRNQFVANMIRESGIATFLFDLLTSDEEAIDNYTREFRFDIELLARRLVEATKWLAQETNTRHLTPGYFGASTGGGAALVAAAELGDQIGAVVSRGGRPDLAGDALDHVRSPSLLIVGGLDGPVIKMNQDAYSQLHCVKDLKVIPGATHLFEEPGKLQEAASLAAEWFLKHLEE